MHSHSKNQLVALVGPPNAGKTTLYNWLTGSKFKTVNYPGSTVEYSIGNLAPHFGESCSIMDTPGTYSLFPKSPDEEVTHRAIFQESEFGSAEVVIVVVDGTQLARNLVLAEQVKKSGFKLVIAVTMVDLLRKNKSTVNFAKLSAEFSCPVVPIEGRLGGGVDQLATAIHQQLAKNNDGAVCPLQPWTSADYELKYAHYEDLIKKASDSNNQSLESIKSISNQIDRVVLHPGLGILIFFGIMLLLFSSIFWLAAPFMDWIDGAFSWLSVTTVKTLGENLGSDFLSNGVISSFAAVLVFVPQVFILFFGIGVLEDTGYLARAAAIIDRPFSKLGMNGRAFVPVLSGFACAVPALMATRTIGSARDRFITAFIVPLMACSARLPVYALLLSFLFTGEASWKPGLVMAALYIGSAILGAIVAGIIHLFMKKSQQSFFMMELPLYRQPQWRVVFKSALSRTQGYVMKAGPVIFTLALILWVGMTFPNYSEADRAKRLETSYAGQVGQVIEPLFEPLGVDWRVGVGLISAFAAREVFVSTLAVLFNVEDSEEDSMQESLLTELRNAQFSDGRPIFTVASVSALIIYFVIALQCISTVAVARKEMASWGFAMTQLFIYNVGAYLIAALVFRIIGTN